MAGDQYAGGAGGAEWLLCRSKVYTACVSSRRTICTVGIVFAVVSVSGCQDDALFQSSAILPLLSSSRPASHCIASSAHASRPMRRARAITITRGCLRRSCLICDPHDGDSERRAAVHTILATTQLHHPHKESTTPPPTPWPSGIPPRRFHLTTATTADTAAPGTSSSSPAKAKWCVLLDHHHTLPARTTDPPPLSAWPSGSPPSRPRTRPRSSRMSPS